VSKTSLGDRLANAVLAYARYAAKLVCPTDLAIIYPHPRHWPMALAFGAATLLAVWTFLCVYNWRRWPFLAFGWFWFLGTLVPTIGLIQVGSQSMADRYTYIPSIGFFIVVVWGVAAWFQIRGGGGIIPAALAGAALLGCAVLTSRQISFWTDGVTLFHHAVDVTVDNYAAENVLGKAYEKLGDNLDALVFYQLSVQTEDRFPESQFNLATCLLTQGRTADGIEHLRKAAALEPGDPDIQFDLGVYFSLHGSWTNAINCFSNSLAVRPDFARAEFNWGNALANSGHLAEAEKHFRAALRLDPNMSQAQTNLNRLLLDRPAAR
jgi:tetratricopeptide (TPR) repeat protein